MPGRLFLGSLTAPGRRGKAFPVGPRPWVKIHTSVTNHSCKAEVMSWLSCIPLSNHLTHDWGNKTINKILINWCVIRCLISVLRYLVTFPSLGKSKTETMIARNFAGIKKQNALKFILTTTTTKKKTQEIDYLCIYLANCIYPSQQSP